MAGKKTEINVDYSKILRLPSIRIHGHKMNRNHQSQLPYSKTQVAIYEHCVQVLNLCLCHFMQFICMPS